MEQIVMESVHNMYYCAKCEWCGVWHVEDKPHTCETKQLDKEDKEEKEEVAAR